MLEMQSGRIKAFDRLHCKQDEVVSLLCTPQGTTLGPSLWFLYYNNLKVNAFSFQQSVIIMLKTPPFTYLIVITKLRALQESMSYK